MQGTSTAAAHQAGDGEEKVKDLYLRAAKESPSVDRLLRRISDLDERFSDGTLEKEDYEWKRRGLMERLDLALCALPQIRTKLGLLLPGLREGISEEAVVSNLAKDLHLRERLEAGSLRELY